MSENVYLCVLQMYEFYEKKVLLSKVGDKFCLCVLNRPFKKLGEEKSGICYKILNKNVGPRGGQSIKFYIKDLEFCGTVYEVQDDITETQIREIVITEMFDSIHAMNEPEEV